MPVSRRSAGGKRLPFVREIRRGHRIGDRARRAPATRPPPPTAPWPHLAARHADPVEQQLQMKLRMGLLAAAVLVRPKRVPFLLGQDVRKPQARQDDHAFGHPRDARDQRRDGRRGGRDAGRDREAGRRLVLPALGQRAQQPVAPLGEVDRAPLGQQLRPALVDQLKRSSDFSQWRASSLGFGRRLPQAAPGRSPRSAARRASARDRRPAAALSAVPSPSRRSPPASASARADRSPAGSPPLVDPVERAADPLVELGIADRDQPRQQQPAAARPDERFGDGAHRAIVGQQDAARGQRQRVLAEARDQARGKRVGEASDATGMVKTATRCGSDILERRFRHRDRLRACRRRTTGPGGRRRSSGPPRSPGPTGCWSRTAPPAHRAAAASRPSGCR